MQLFGFSKAEVNSLIEIEKKQLEANLLLEFSRDIQRLEKTAEIGGAVHFLTKLAGAIKQDKIVKLKNKKIIVPNDDTLVYVLEKGLQLIEEMESVTDVNSDNSQRSE